MCLEERFSEPETFVLRNHLHTGKQERSEFKQDVIGQPYRHVGRTLPRASVDVLRAGKGLNLTVSLPQITMKTQS